MPPRKDTTRKTDEEIIDKPAVEETATEAATATDATEPTEAATATDAAVDTKLAKKPAPSHVRGTKGGLTVYAPNVDRAEGIAAHIEGYFSGRAEKAEVSTAGAEIKVTGDITEDFRQYLNRINGVKLVE